jgi:hypothetical protein
MSRSRSGMPKIRLAVAVVALVGAAAPGAPAQSLPPPPSGGFDTSVCRGRGVDPPKNGRLIGQVKGKRGLFSIRPDGSGLRRETKPPRLYQDFYPTPSRDGRSIAFLRLFMPNEDDRPKRLMVLHLRTHTTRVLTSDIFQPFAPAWSPDGKWIAAGTVQTTHPGGSFERTATAIRPVGTGRRVLDAGGYLLLNGSWSPNGRCFAALARFRTDANSGFNGGDAGVAVLGSDGGRPNTSIPRPPPCSSAVGCVSTVPSLGRNEPNYVAWTADGRGILALRGVYLKPPEHSYDDPDETDVIRAGLSSSQAGKVLIRNATAPRMSPDGRFITAFSIRRLAFGVFGLDGRMVRLLPRFIVQAWAPTQR